MPVIPDTQLIPNLTIPSAPQRALPPATLRPVPTARFQLEPTVAVIEEYTDNFNLTEQNKKSNFRSTVSPGLTVNINSPVVKGLVSYKFAPSYDTFTDDVSLFHSLLGQVGWDVDPRLKLTLADTFTRSDQPSEADRLGLRQQRQTFTSNTLVLASDYLISRIATRESFQMSSFSDESGQETKSYTLALSATAPVYETNSVSAGYEYLISNTSGGNTTTTTGTTGTSGDFDLTGHKFTAGAARRLHTLLSAGLSSSYALRTISRRSGDSDFKLWNAAVFTDYEVPGRLKVNSSLGVSGLSSDSSSSVGPNLSTRTSLSYQFARALVSLAVDKGFSETFTEGENFGVVETEGVTASLFYPFTPTFTGTLTGNYRRNKTTNIGDGALGNQGNQQTENYGGSVSFAWRLRPGLLLELSYTYTRQVGDNRQTGTGTTTTGGFGIENTYTENRVRAAVNLAF